jgi:hypothetical protein
LGFILGVGKFLGNLKFSWSFDLTHLLDMKCRICFEGENLITVCACKGTLEFIHLKCLEEWKRISQNTHCEICQKLYSNTSPSLLVTSILISWTNYLTWYLCIEFLSYYLFNFMEFPASLLPGITFLTLRHSKKLLILSFLSIVLFYHNSIFTWGLAILGNSVLLYKINKRTQKLSPKLLKLLVEFNKHDE